MGKPQGNVSAFCCSSRFANEEPRKEAKEVEYSGDWMVVGGQGEPLCHSDVFVSWSDAGRESGPTCSLSGPFLQLHNKLVGGGGWVGVTQFDQRSHQSGLESASPIFPGLLPS